MGKQDGLADFQRFDFDKDERWNSYLKNVEITSNDPAVLQRLKRRWYKKNIDVNFDVDWLADLGKAQSNAPKPSTASNNNTTSEQAAPRPSTNAQSGNTGGYTSSSSSYGSAPTSQASSKQQLYLTLQSAALVILALLHVVTMFMAPKLSWQFYRIFLQMVIVGNLYRLYVKFALPQLRPFSLNALRDYAIRVGPTSEFHFAILGFAFSAHPPMTLVLIPAVLPAVYELLNKVGQSESGAIQKLLSRVKRLARSQLVATQSASAMCEIMLGFLLIMQILGRARNIMLTFAYWNLLKMRYHVSDAAAHHRTAWYNIGQKTAKIRGQVPIIEKAITYASNWFLNPGR